MSGREDDKASTYSLGMKQRLGDRGRLVAGSELLVLDEPTNGLDPAGIVEIRELLKVVGDWGRTVVVSSHLLGEIQAMVDSLVVIRFGELMYSGSLEGLMEQATERVVAAPEIASDIPRWSRWSRRAAGRTRSRTTVVVDMPAERRRSCRAATPPA